jgi:hypothetical protein
VGNTILRPYLPVSFQLLAVKNRIFHRTQASHSTGWQSHCTDSPRRLRWNQIFSYVVGCDGRTGITHKFTCHDFESKKTGVSLRRVNCKVCWRRLESMEQIWMFYFDSDFAVVVPRPRNMYRIITVEPRSNILERDPTLEEMQTKLRDVSKDSTLELSEPE